MFGSLQRRAERDKCSQSAVIHEAVEKHLSGDVGSEQNFLAHQNELRAAVEKAVEGAIDRQFAQLAKTLRDVVVALNRIDQRVFEFETANETINLALAALLDSQSPGAYSEILQRVAASRAERKPSFGNRRESRNADFEGERSL